MNINQEEIATMLLTCRANRRKQIASALRAVNYLQYQGIVVPPPTGISLPRWRAMIQSIIVRGLPT